MRQIVLDTETTGIEPREGHRIIEIGCVELIDRKLTGNHFHVYINPEREVEEEAFQVHGISNEFLAGKPVFNDILDDFVSFVGDSELVIHNAAFDMGFLNHELNLARRGPRPLESRCHVLDTLLMAREKHPRQKNNLDALCKRYDIDNSKRELHGALLDAEILALVYLAMTGGQFDMFAAEDVESNNIAQSTSSDNVGLSYRGVSRQGTITVIKPTEIELSAHDEFIAMLHEKSGLESIWE